MHSHAERGNEGKILAVDVLPLPLSPEKRYAWESLFVSSAKESVWEIESCPIRSSNRLGRYFLANANDTCSSFG